MPVAEDLYYFLYEGGSSALPVVLLHGAGGVHLHWPPEIRRMKGGRIYALDLPGHGRSDDVDGQQSIASYAAAVVRWLDVLEIYQAVLIGHSMGGAVALTLALDYPERVSGIGLISTGARLRVHPGVITHAANPTLLPNAIQQIIALSFNQSTPLRLVEMAAQRLAETRQSVFYGDLLACDQFDRMADIHRVSCPTLVLCGLEDQMTPLRYSQFLVDHIPQAQLQVVPEAGHMVMLEQPALVQAYLEAFLGRWYTPLGERKIDVPGD